MNLYIKAMSASVCVCQVYMICIFLIMRGKNKLELKICWCQKRGVGLSGVRKGDLEFLVQAGNAVLLH
jgi:hypothetical protein